MAKSIRIIIEVPGEAPLELDLEPGGYVLGRGEGCELFIEHEGISRRHARLTVSDGQLAVEDLDSSNGTFLDGAPVGAVARLEPDSTITLGADAVCIRLASPDAGSAPSPDEPGDAPAEAPAEVNLFAVNYHFRHEIARGGMGAVIEAEDANTGRTVAVKKMLDDARVSEDARHRFLQEARVMGHLEHPNIVPMHELALDERGNPYYTMKRIQGTDLQDVLNRIKEGDEATIAAYPLRTLLGIFLKVCDAMAFAHSRGVIHRDLKPENIMLGEFGDVLVADWGLAKILPGTPLAFLHMAVEEGAEIPEDEVSEEGSFKTMEGSVMGTPNYMAPEQAEGKTAQIDRLSDIFSLGGILYTILTLRPPVLGKTVSEVLENMRAGYIAPPVLYNKVKSARLIGRGKRAEEEVILRHCPNQRIPEALSRVAMHAMKLDRGQRYQKVRDLQKDVEAWQLGYATTAEEADFRRHVALFISRNKATAIVGAVVCLIGLGLLGAAVYADRKAGAAMAEMQAAVPLIEEQLDSTTFAGDFGRALARLDSLILLLPDNPDYHLRRARILQSLYRFDEAAAAFKRAGERAGNPERYADAARFSSEMAAAVSEGELDPAAFEQFVNGLDREQRFVEARFHRRRRIAAGRERLETLRESFNRLADEKDRILRSALPPEAASSIQSPRPTAEWDFEFDGSDRLGEMRLHARPGARIEDGAAHLDGDRGFIVTDTFTNELAEFTIEVWAEFPPPGKEDATLAALHANGTHFDALRFNHLGTGAFGIQRRRPGGRYSFMGRELTNRFAGLNQFVFGCGPAGTFVGVNGTNVFRAYPGPVAVAGHHVYGPQSWRIAMGRASHRNGGPLFAGRIEEARFFDRVLLPGEVEALWRRNPLSRSADALLARLDASQRERIAETERRLAEARGEIKSINRLVSAGQSEAMLRSYRQLMKDNGAPEFAIDRLQFNWDGRLRLDIRNRQLKQLDWLRGVPIEMLWLNDNPVTDLSPLRGMPLSLLYLNRTKVVRLDALAGMKLQSLHFDNCSITDLTPLKGMPLRILTASWTRVSDLSPLKGMALTRLNIDGCRNLTSLAPLAGAPLEWLSARQLPGQCGLTPLKGAPLKTLSLVESRITSLAGLEESPLTDLDLGGCRNLTSLAPLAGRPLRKLALWSNTRITDLSPLAGMPLDSLHLSHVKAGDWSVLKGMPLQYFEARHSSLRDYSVLNGMPLKRYVLGDTKGADFEVFRQFSPGEVVLFGTSLSDLSLIGGTNLALLDLRGTPIASLAPLAGRSVRELWLRDCARILDMRPLLECRIERLVVPPNARNLALLREHPTITHIAWKLPTFDWWERNRWQGAPSKEEFWRAWDAGKRSP